MQNYIIFSPENLPIAFPNYYHPDNTILRNEFGDIVIEEKFITGNDADERLLLDENALTVHINYYKELMLNLRAGSLRDLPMGDIRDIVVKYTLLTNFYDLITEQSFLRPQGLELTNYGEEELKGENNASGSYKKRRGRKKKKKTLRKKKKKKRKRGKGKTRRIR